MKKIIIWSAIVLALGTFPRLIGWTPNQMLRGNRQHSVNENVGFGPLLPQGARQQLGT